MQAVGYISSLTEHEIDREVDNGIQLARIKKFCEEQNIKLTHTYIEPPDSRDDYKPQLLKLINEASSKSIKKVIILKYEKLGKDKGLKNWIIEELTKKKVAIVSIAEGEDTDMQYNRAIHSKVQDIKENVKDIPSLPEVVNKIVELVQNPNSSAAQMSRIISHDPGLTSRVLRLVNSAYYGFPKQISDIQHAIAILGFTTMRGLVLSSSIFKIFTPKNSEERMFDYKNFWKHSLATAILSKQVYKFLFYEEDENLFSAAILHNIGQIILDQYDHDNYKSVLVENIHPVNAESLIAAERQYCNTDHCEIGHLVAESWNLPENISEVIKFHHHPLESEDYSTLASVVYVSSLLSTIIIHEEKFDPELFDQAVLGFIGLSEDDLNLMYHNSTEEIEKIQNLEAFFK